MLASVAPIAAAVDLPVTADMEAGYGDDAEDAAATARGVARSRRRRPEPRGHERRRATSRSSRSMRSSRRSRRSAAVAAEAGVPLVLNARTDVFIGAVGDPSTRARARGRARTRLPRRRSRLHLRPGVTDRHARSPRSSRASAARSASSPGPARRPSPSSPRSASHGSASARGRTAPHSRWRGGWPTRHTASGSLEAMTAGQVQFADAQALFDD